MPQVVQHFSNHQWGELYLCVAPKAHITSIGKKVQPTTALLAMVPYGKKVQPPLIYVMAVICMQLALILPAQNYWLTQHKQRAACRQNKAVCVHH